MIATVQRYAISACFMKTMPKQLSPQGTEPEPLR